MINLKPEHSKNRFKNQLFSWNIHEKLENQKLRHIAAAMPGMNRIGAKASGY